MAEVFVGAGCLTHKSNYPLKFLHIRANFCSYLHYNARTRSSVFAQFYFPCQPPIQYEISERGNGRGMLRMAASWSGLFPWSGADSDIGESTREQYAPIISLINGYDAHMSSLSNSELFQRTSAFREQIRQGASLDYLLPEAFAVVREASKRVLGLRPFDVQLLGGIILHGGEIAELRTGEGKTLVAILPSYLNALTGKGVHIVTVNDYLARRDCKWVGRVLQFLGLKVGLIQQNMTSKERKDNYSCDITYVTNSELGFDFLRDSLAMHSRELVLRSFNYCVLDEIDSILIDEARTPLIISGPAERSANHYRRAEKVATALLKDLHYIVNEKQKTVLLTECGYCEAEKLLDAKDLYTPNEEWAFYILNALKAKELIRRDVDYILCGKVACIVDEFTGRMMEGRRWSNSLHQAVEIKEGLAIQSETEIIASITYQNFYRKFPKLCGMTGTAATESAEFEKIYNLKVKVVPTNKAHLRKDEPDIIFSGSAEKWNHVVVEVSRMHKLGRPVLVGTTSVEKSNFLSKKLREAGILHEVLNARPENVQKEAEIVAQSGRVGAVTIATNMAGRGTDICLGGNAEYMAQLKLREILTPKIVMTDGSRPMFMRNYPRIQWEASTNISPYSLSNKVTQLAKEVEQLVAEKWGQAALTELEAEQMLSYACQKEPTTDVVVEKLRSTYLAIIGLYNICSEEEKKKVLSTGGLFVLGTERHASRRTDNQLRGRSGRQGDPGGSQFFVGLDDNIFRTFGTDHVQRLMRTFGSGYLHVKSKKFARVLDEVQQKIENYYFDIRKQLYEYDEVLNSQRDHVYSERRLVLESDNLLSLLLKYAELAMDDIVKVNVGCDTPKSSWDLENLVAIIHEYCSLLKDLTPDLLRSKCSSWKELHDYLRFLGRRAYVQKRHVIEAEIPSLMKEVERYIILSNIDRLWKEHLQSLEFVKEVVMLRTYAHRDPLVEYKIEAHDLFVEMMAKLRRDVIYSIYQFVPKGRDISSVIHGPCHKYADKVH